MISIALILFFRFPFGTPGKDVCLSIVPEDYDIFQPSERDLVASLDYLILDIPKIDEAGHVSHSMGNSDLMISFLSAF